MKELIVSVEDEIENILLIEDGVLVEKYEDSKFKRRLEGNIYIGKVQNILPGLQAAFVNVGENKNALYGKDSEINISINTIEGVTYVREFNI